MREYVVTPIEKTGYDGHIIYSTQYPLALQARQSTKEQSLQNQESYESQTTVLLEHALDMGWKRLRETPDDDGDIIPFIENKRKDGKIVDASGTKRVDQRPTMQDLWYHIEHDLVKAVMTRGVDRLFRHVAMIEPANFADLCRRHRCIVITVKEVRRRTRIEVYNFHDNPEDIGAFLAEAQAGADFILNQIEWMHRCKLNKAIRGGFDGRAIPVGFLLVDGTYVVYEPHAVVVRWLFRRYRELAGNFALLKGEVAQLVAEQGYLFPFFPGTVQYPHMEIGRNDSGYTLSAVSLKDLLCNPVYLGWWLVYETIDKGQDTERRVLRTKIENHHEAIVPPADFWYAHERLASQDAPRSRYNKVGTIPCDALLNGLLTSTGERAVYVYQTKETPEKAMYVIEDTKETYGDHTHGSLYVRELDRLFTDHLLAKLEAGKRLQEQYQGELFPGVNMADQLDIQENVMVMRLEEVIQQQDVAAAGIDANLLKYTEEAASLDRTLHYGAAKLTPEKIAEYAERLAELSVTIAQLQAKKRRTAETQAELSKFNRKLDTVPDAWKKMTLSEQRRFIALVTQQLVLTKPAPNWLQLDIIWLWEDEETGEPVQTTCYIWQRRGKGETWEDAESDILRMWYPTADRAALLDTLPNRSWSAIRYQASRLGLLRPYRFNNSHLHRFVSLDDASFMAQAGIIFEEENQYQHVWWMNASQSEESRFASL
jgi:hypothetical protein